MEIKMNPRSQFPGRGPCLQMVGDWVTEAVWNVVHRLLNDNLMSSPVYQARIKSSAFFQGGHSDPRAKFILIEFWAAEEKCQDFIRILNVEVNKIIHEDSTKIRIVANTSNTKDVENRIQVCSMIAEETGCEMAPDNELFMHHCSAMFVPKSNIEYEKVHFLLNWTFYKEVKRINWLDKWENEAIDRRHHS
jgi:hypothetical protein